jgi:hypothetical protein
MFLLFYDPNIQEHPFECGKNVTIDAVPVNFKNFNTDAFPFRSVVTSNFAHHCLQSLVSDGSA